MGGKRFVLSETKNPLKNIPISMLSAKSLSIDIIGGEDVEELVDYIQKPFSEESLIKKVSHILDVPGDIKPDSSRRGFLEIRDDSVQKYENVKIKGTP
jgi:DNA-binding response OmpR family regulator